MNVNDLPVEMLVRVLGNVPPSQLVSCRRVCRRWGRAVDEFLGEEVYRELCTRRYGGAECEAARRKAGLAWRPLYRALGLWSRVASATVVRHGPLTEDVDSFRVLRGTVAHALATDRAGREGYDTICYYSIVTLQEIRRKRFEVTFTRFDENEHFIVLERDDRGYGGSARSVYVVLKSNKEECVMHRHDIRRCVMLDTEIYFRTTDHEHWRLRLVKKDGVVTADTELLTEFVTQETARAFSERHPFDVETNGIRAYDDLVRGDVVFRASTSSPSMLNTDTASNPKFFRYGKVLFVVKTSAMVTVDIYYDPFDRDGRLRPTDVAPDKTIDIKLFGNCGNFANFWEDFDLDVRGDPSDVELDAVETADGHRLVLRRGRALLVVALRHEHEHDATMVVQDDHEHTGTARARSPAATTSGGGQ